MRKSMIDYNRILWQSFLMATMEFNEMDWTGKSHEDIDKWMLNRTDELYYQLEAIELAKKGQCLHRFIKNLGLAVRKERGIGNPSLFFVGVSFEDASWSSSRWDLNLKAKPKRRERPNQSFPFLFKR